MNPPRSALMLAAVTALTLSVGCASPSVPQSATAVPTAATFPVLHGPYSVAGRVLETRTRAAVAGATLRFDQASGEVTTVTTTVNGEFEVAGVSAGTVNFSITASGYLLRQSHFSVTASRSDVALDVIGNVAPFDLHFYRALARDGFEGRNLALSVWPVDPRFYVRTTTSDTSEDLDPAFVRIVENVIRTSVPELSGGRLHAVTIDEGRSERPRQSGWVNVSFQRAPVDGFAGGRADLGPVSGGGGLRAMYYDHDPAYNCEWPSEEIVQHEMVHVMGFSHTSPTNVEFLTGPGCPVAGRPERTQLHAAIAYARQPGNVDEDSDPSYVYTFGLARQQGSEEAACSLNVSRSVVQQVASLIKRPDQMTRIK